MADISKIKTPDGTEYNIKDATARSDMSGKQATITASGVLVGDGSGGVTAKTLDTSSLSDDNDHVPTSGLVKSALEAVYDLETFTTLSGLSTLLDSTFDDMPQKSARKIRVQASGAVTPFLSGAYEGTIYKSGAAYNSNAILYHIGEGTPVLCRRTVANGWTFDNLPISSDLASIHATGTTNATGATITSGTYFYLNDTLVRAISNIASGATFTENTNYQTVTAGALNQLRSTMETALAGKGNVRKYTRYLSSPNGQIVLNLAYAPNALMGLLVLSTYSTTPPKSSLYNVLAESPYNSRFATIAENLNINTSITYDKTNYTLTVTFNSTATYMQAEFYTPVS